MLDVRIMNTDLWNHPVEECLSVLPNIGIIIFIYGQRSTGMLHWSITGTNRYITKRLC